MRPISKLGFLILLIACHHSEIKGQEGTLSTTVRSTNGFGGTFGGSNNSMFWKKEYKSRSEIEKKDIEGSYYDHDEFRPGTVYYRKEKFPNVRLRYNAFDDEVEMFSDNEILSLNKVVEISCEIGKEKLEYAAYYDKYNKSQSGFLFLLHDGNKHKLYYRKVKWLKKGTESKNPLHKSYPNRMMDYSEYYFVDIDGQKRFLKPKKKDVLNVFDIKIRPDVKKYIKSGGLKLNDPKHLQEIFMYCESN